MRSDSVRDLYAKSLALIGLAALASIGALVDYWPSTGAFPRVTAASLVRPATLMAVGALTVPQPDVPLAAPATVRAIPIVDESLAVPVMDVAIEPVEPAPIPQADAEAVQPVPDMFLPIALEPLPVSMLSVPATSVLLSAPPPLAAVRPAAPQGSGGILGVFKKTGSSIVTAGAKTGSTIVSAFRAVGSALRRLL